MTRLRIPAINSLSVGAMALYVSSIGVGGLNYVYNIIMARQAFLGPADFSILAALGSLLYIEGIIVATLTTVTANHVASLSGRNQNHELVSFLRHLISSVALYGFLVAVMVVAAAPLITHLLHLPSPVPVFLVAPVLWLSLLLGVTVGALQGKTAFITLALVGMSGAAVRLLVAIPLVALWHLGVNGAFLANSIAAALPLVLSIWVLRIHLFTDMPGPPVAVPVQELWQYARHTLLTVAGLSLLFSVDILLARSYLSASDAGLYAGLALIGRIVFFFTLPITTIVFPLVVARVAARLSYRGLVLKSGGGLALICLIFLGACVFFPRFIILATVGVGYVPLAGSLWVFALFFVCLSITHWLAQMLLAVGKTRLLFVPLVCVGLQIIFIMRWHSGSVAIAVDSLVASLIALIVLSFHWLSLMRR